MSTYLHEEFLDEAYLRRLERRKRVAIEQVADQVRRADDEAAALRADTAQWFRRRFPRRARRIEQDIEERSLRVKALYHRRRMS
jgi:hypothetical protein